jgi:zinc/manganese transport system substrate-binding protein
MPWTATFRRRAAALVVTFAAACAAAAALDAQTASPIKVVAAENFYGDIAQQIGADRVSVTSILSDPGVDPHQYESRMDDAKAIADADLVIENGAGYDAWMDGLLSASPRASRVVLKAFTLAPDKLPDNPHLWYGVDNVGAMADAVAQALARALPADAALFSKNDQVFRQSLVAIKRRFAQISSRWAGTPIGLTETIFLYQTRALGLRVLTPLEYQKAVSEGNDPPADAVVAAENQITQKKIRILLVNVQSISDIAARAKDEAAAAGIPVVGLTETMPAGETYQSWMLNQLDQIASALAGGSR